MTSARFIGIILMFIVLFKGNASDPVQNAKSFDLAFLVDESDDTQLYFEYIKTFYASLTDSLTKQTNNHQFALAWFATGAGTYFNFNKYQNSQQVENAIESIGYDHPGARDIARGLQLMQSQIFTAANGHRSGVPSFVILYTSGIHVTYPDHDPTAVANQLKAAGITVFVVCANDVHFPDSCDGAELPLLASKVEYFYKSQSTSTINLLVPDIVNDLMAF